MVDKIDSQRVGKRLKHTRKSHYVSGLFGSRKVGISYDVEPLPEGMREEPEEAHRGDSHRVMLADIERSLGLPKSYIDETNTELYKKGFCPYCERKLSCTVCSQFASMVSSQAADHAKPCCPDCGEWIDEFEDVEVYEPVFDELPTELPETELRVRVQPCECMFDERMMAWYADVEPSRPEDRV